MFRENLVGDLGGRKRRDRLYIMAEVLEIAKNGCLKTQIMYRANLSFAQLNEYLGFLLEVGLLKETRENEKNVYRTTRKGFRFLRNYYKVRDLLRRKGGKSGLENCGALCLGNHRGG
jgi:predicted transcriptional regulator